MYINFSYASNIQRRMTFCSEWFLLLQTDGCSIQKHSTLSRFHPFRSVCWDLYCGCKFAMSYTLYFLSSYFMIIVLWVRILNFAYFCLRRLSVQLRRKEGQVYTIVTVESLGCLYMNSMSFIDRKQIPFYRGT